MRYMMIVCYDPTVPETGDAPDIDDWVGEMDGRGVRLEGRPLSPEEATTVRVVASPTPSAVGSAV